MTVCPLETKLLKAKISLMEKSIFISTISLNIKHIISNQTPTAATNGSKIWYNPTYIEKLSLQQLTGLMAHECWHIAFQHMKREGSRDPELWNIAGDIVINNMLLNKGFRIPTTECINHEYDDLSTEQVYNELLKKQKKLPNLFIKDLIDVPEPGESNDKIRNIIVKAHTQSKLSSIDKGDIPDEVIRKIEELVNPKLPWYSLLNKFLNERTREEFSWGRKNRRFATYLPSLYSYGLSHLTFAIDTSGSISDQQLQELLSEIQGIHQTFNPQKMTIIDCDCKINNIYECDQSTDIKKLSFTGGGGTSFKPVLEYIEKHPTQALIYFTDLYGESSLEEQDYPIMWICNSTHEPMNIGETIYIKD